MGITESIGEDYLSHEHISPATCWAMPIPRPGRSCEHTLEWYVGAGGVLLSLQGVAGLHFFRGRKKMREESFRRAGADKDAH